MQEKVSIITPLYNCSEFIEQTITSVINQSYENWEMIIVDDCSTDGGDQIVKNISQSNDRITFIKNTENLGGAVTRNIAIDHADGKYIAFLDSDDLWHPEKLEKQIQYMESENKSFTFTSYHKVDEKGNTYLGRVNSPKKVSYRGLLKTNVIGCLTAIYDTDQFGKVSMPLIRKRQDFGLWLKLLKKSEYAYGLDEDLATYRVRTNSISSNKLNTISSIWKLYREVEKLSIVESFYFSLHYSTKGVFRKIFISRFNNKTDQQ